MDYKDENIWLMQGDCLERMKEIPDGSVDMILCDLPYGTTKCSWDSVIPFEPLWEQYERVIKDNGAIVLTASQPFTSALVMSNPKMFKYEWIWLKTRASNFQNARRMPMKRHENVCVFYKKPPTYNLELERLDAPINNSRKNKGGELLGKITDSGSYFQKETGFNFSDIKFSNPNNGNVHPTQKPVALMEYLIRTYTNEGETVLDNCMGGGSTGVACHNLNRKFIGIELDQDYFDVSKNRILGNSSMLSPTYVEGL